MATVRMRDLGVSGYRSEIFAFKPHDILIDPGHNPRDWNWADLTEEQKDGMEGLQASILQNGVERPVLVRKSRGSTEIWLVDGERRLRAARALVDAGAEHMENGWQGVIPVMLVTPEDEGDCLMRALRANDGEPLTKIELGRAYKKLLQSEWSYTKERIALETGVRTRFVTEALMLAEMPEAVQEMVERGEVAPAAALHQVKVSENNAAEVLREKVDQAKAEGKTTLKREKVKKQHEPAKAAPRPEHSRVAIPLRCGMCHNEVQRLEPSTKDGRMICSGCVKAEAEAIAHPPAPLAHELSRATAADFPDGSLARRQCLLDDLRDAAQGVIDDVTDVVGPDQWDDLDDTEVLKVSAGAMVELRNALAGWKAEGGIEA